MGLTRSQIRTLMEMIMQYMAENSVSGMSSYAEEGGVYGCGM